MTLAEFKAWFDGFTEDMDGPPNVKQWKRIKARVKEIDGVAVTREVYVERYRRYLDWYPSTATWLGNSTTYPVIGGSDDVASGDCFETSNSMAAMTALGKAEAFQ